MVMRVLGSLLLTREIFGDVEPAHFAHGRCNWIGSDYILTAGDGYDENESYVDLRLVDVSDPTNPLQVDEAPLAGTYDGPWSPWQNSLGWEWGNDVLFVMDRGFTENGQHKSQVGVTLVTRTGSSISSQTPQDIDGVINTWSWVWGEISPTRGFLLGVTNEGSEWSQVSCVEIERDGSNNITATVHDINASINAGTYGQYPFMPGGIVHLTGNKFMVAFNFREQPGDGSGARILGDFDVQVFVADLTTGVVDDAVLVDPEAAPDRVTELFYSWQHGDSAEVTEGLVHLSGNLFAVAYWDLVGAEGGFLPSKVGLIEWDGSTLSVVDVHVLNGKGNWYMGRGVAQNSSGCMIGETQFNTEIDQPSRGYFYVSRTGNVEGFLPIEDHRDLDDPNEWYPNLTPWTMRNDGNLIGGIVSEVDEEGFRFPTRLAIYELDCGGQIWWERRRKMSPWTA